MLTKEKKVDRRRIKTHGAFLNSLKHKDVPKAYHNHLIHKDASKRDWSNESYIRIVIIDPGEVNLGFRIERRDLKTRAVVTEIMIRKKLSEDDEYKPADPLYGNLMEFFEPFIPYFMDAHIILMEKQVPDNTGMTRLGPFIMGYFSTILRDARLLPLLIELFPSVKTQVLADKSLLKILGAKKWSVRVSTTLLKVRGDEKGLALLERDPQKRDDMADTIIMPEAFLLLLFFEFNFAFIPDLYRVLDLRGMIRKRLDLARLLYLVGETRS